jgi:hypothetical protein
VEGVSRIKNTHVFYLEPNSIDRTSEPPILAQFFEKKLTGIRSFHYFLLVTEDNKDFLHCSKLSNLEP